MRIIVWTLLTAACATYMCGPVLDPDLWWHITVGRWIIGHGEIPVADHWTMFSRGTPWRAYSWSVEILFAAIDGRYGIHGLMALKILLAAALGLTLLRVYARLSADLGIGALLACFGTVACFNHFTLRPQALIWILFAVLIGEAERIRRDGWSRSGGIRITILLALWSNIHLSAVLGVLTVFFWIYRRGEVNPAVRALACAVAGTFITPYLGGEWLTFFSKTSHPFQHAAIAEFQPATILQYSTAFLIIPLLGIGIVAHLRPAAINVERLMLGLIFVGGGLAVVKFLPFAVIVLLAIFAVTVRELGPTVDIPLIEGLRRLRDLVERVPREGLGFIAVALITVNCVKLWREPINLTIVPQAAMDFILAKQLPHPLLNGFGNGGYVMYRLSDANGNLAHPVAIDGRTNLIPHHIWESYMNTHRGVRNWRAFIDTVKPHSILWKNESPLISILLYGKEWCMVYRDGNSENGYSVFVDYPTFESRRAELTSENCGS